CALRVDRARSNTNEATRGAVPEQTAAAEGAIPRRGSTRIGRGRGEGGHLCWSMSWVLCVRAICDAARPRCGRKGVAMDEQRGAAEVVADPAEPHDTDMSAAERVADPALSDGADEPTAPDAPGTDARKRSFPSPLTILLIVILGVWLLALVIPAGEYQ